MEVASSTGDPLTMCELMNTDAATTKTIYQEQRKLA